MGEPIVKIVEESSFSDSFKSIIESIANKAINKGEMCNVGLSGKDIFFLSYIL